MLINTRTQRQNLSTGFCSIFATLLKCVVYYVPYMKVNVCTAEAMVTHHLSNYVGSNAFFTAT